VEITQAGLRQVVLKPKIGFGFAEALRALLRADPDVIMIGEMRDAETATIAIRAALTGHLVFSTLHTNSAPDTVERLIDMGADPLVFGDALLCVLAQRLARRLCEACKSLEPTLDEDRESLRSALGPLSETTPVRSLQWRARGCEACRMSGYRGRVALHEVLVVDERLRSAIHARAGVEKIRAAAVEGGMTTLLQDGAMKCLAGITDLSQVLAVCAR
jgi:type II secretory ATPase GspE/PulE/Tfp pilus assembly ATPase PilB-like protein